MRILPCWPGHTGVHMCTQTHKPFPDMNMPLLDTRVHTTDIIHILCTHSTTITTTTTTWLCYPHIPVVRGFYDNDTSLATHLPRVPEGSEVWAYQRRTEGSQEIEMGHSLALSKKNWKPGSLRGRVAGGRKGSPGVGGMEDLDPWS